MTVPVNTTTQTPAPAGTYPADLPAQDGFYCTLGDVFVEGVGVRWEEVQRELDAYRVMLSGDYPGVTDVPALIRQVLIPRAESEVDEYLGMTYKPTVVSRFFDGDGTDTLLLPFYPVTAVLRCAIYAIPSVPFTRLTSPRFIDSLGVIDGDTQYADADLLVDGARGKLIIPPRVLFGATVALPGWTYNFLKGTRNVEVAWQYGFTDPANVPRAFRKAVALLVARKCLEMTGVVENRGLASSRIGDSQRTVGREKNLPYSDLISRWDNEIAHLLHKYKRVG